MFQCRIFLIFLIFVILTKIQEVCEIQDVKHGLVYILMLRMFFTVPGQPNPPTSITSTTTSITLQWNDLVGTVQETYTVIQDGVEVMSGINTNMATIDGLTSNTNYQFQIKASNDGGDGEISDAQISATSN